MFLDPEKLNEAAPTEVLEAAARGYLGLDQRFLRAFTERKEKAIPALVEFASRDRSDDVVDLGPELIGLFRYWESPEAVPFLVRYIEEDPENVPDEVIEALVHFGPVAVEPLIALYQQLGEADGAEVAFILANLGVRDQRILSLLVDRLPFDLSDSAMLLGIYGDPDARPALEQAVAELAGSEKDLKKELDDVIETLSIARPRELREKDFDLWSLYPEVADLPLDLLDEDERHALLDHPLPSVRATAANTFFNQELTPEERQKLLHLAQHDAEPEVRARAWEALMNATSETEVVEAMLIALRDSNLSLEERGGLIVGLAPEADRNEVRDAIAALYEAPEGRAKALEAMWRSVHPSFRDYFAKHLDDADLETRRSAIWGVGYFGLKSELEHLRKLLDNQELRSDALFAYSLAIPAELSRGRMKGLLARIEKDAHGLSEMEEELVKAALDERLMLAGKEPVFAQDLD